jgi:hypothetical protein
MTDKSYDPYLPVGALVRSRQEGDVGKVVGHVGHLTKVRWEGGGITSEYSSDLVKVRRNPLAKKPTHGSLTGGEWAMIGVGVAVIGAVVYAVAKTQSAASNVSASTTNAANQLSPLSQVASAAQTAQQSVADAFLGGNFQGATITDGELRDGPTPSPGG